jgi:hypothetical protein
VITSAEGRFRFSALPPAGYTISASLDGFQTQHAAVGAAVGQTTRHDVQMQLGAFADVIEVTGQPSLLDPVSTVAGLTVDTDELSSRIPVSRDVTRLSLLAPGTVPGDQSFESQGFTPGQSLVSFGGAAINENSYLVNGLNITSLSTMMGSSFVPMEFVDQAQIKTGGYQAEFGRSTGGVVNLVTKSGTNTLRASFSTYWSPKGLQEQEPDIYRRGSDGSVSVSGHNQSEERRSLEANASLGGPLLEDRLFFFAFLRWAEDEAMDIEDTRALRLENSAPYWGGKLDWQASPSHRLEGTYLSDRTDVNASQHAFDPLTRSLDELIGHSIRARGGGNAIFRYTGMLSDSVLFSAQAGRNEFEHSNRQENADACPLVGDYRSGSRSTFSLDAPATREQPIGLTSTGTWVVTPCAPAPTSKPTGRSRARASLEGSPIGTGSTAPRASCPRPTATPTSHGTRNWFSSASTSVTVPTTRSPTPFTCRTAGRWHRA